MLIGEGLTRKWTETDPLIDPRSSACSPGERALPSVEVQAGGGRLRLDKGLLGGFCTVNWKEEVRK